MGMFYPAAGCRCGNCRAAPPEGAYPEVPSLDPDDETGFNTACDCPDGGCPCYGEGYNRGQDKAHFEISAVVEGPAPTAPVAAANPARPSVR